MSLTEDPNGIGVMMRNGDVRIVNEAAITILKFIQEHTFIEPDWIIDWKGDNSPFQIEKEKRQ